MLSIIIPSYREHHLQKTIDSLLEACETDIEIIVVVNGDNLIEPVKPNPLVRVVVIEEPGMRAAINEGLKQSKGAWIMKVDAHCIFAKGFDKSMLEHCSEKRLLIPRRYSLDEFTWARDKERPYRDYHHFEFPRVTKYGTTISVLDWFKRTPDKIDDTMIFQGSCWVANKGYFMKRIGYLDDDPKTYGSFAGEQHEIGLKYWLTDGEIKVNKETWYAHLSKRPRHYDAGIYSRHYKSAPATSKNHTWITKHWLKDEEPGMTHKFEWLVDKFQPPGWEDWKEKVKNIL